MVRDREGRGYWVGGLWLPEPTPKMFQVLDAPKKALGIQS